MPKLTASQFFKKLILVTFACFITSLGINLFIRAGLGADPISLWVQGLVLVFGGDYGMMTLISNACLLVLALCFALRNIYFGTVIVSLALGPFISLQVPFIDAHIALPTDLSGQLLMLAAAILVLTVGVGLTVSLRFGVSSVDAMVLKLSERTGVHYRYLRMASDILFVVTGLAMGAPFGIGTVISAAAMGPSVAFFAKICNRTLLRALGITDPRNEFSKAPAEEPPQGEAQEKCASEEPPALGCENECPMCPQPPAKGEPEEVSAPSVP